MSSKENRRIGKYRKVNKRTIRVIELGQSPVSRLYGLLVCIPIQLFNPYTAQKHTLVSLSPSIPVRTRQCISNYKNKGTPVCYCYNKDPDFGPNYRSITTANCTNDQNLATNSPILINRRPTGSKPLTAESISIT